MHAVETVAEESMILAVASRFNSSMIQKATMQDQKRESYEKNRSNLSSPNDIQVALIIQLHMYMMDKQRTLIGTHAVTKFCFD